MQKIKRRRQRLVLGARHRRPHVRRRQHRRPPPRACSSRAGPTSCSTARPTATACSTTTIVTRLAEVGAAWSPDPTRPPLPAQGAADRFARTIRSARPRPAASPATPSTASNDFSPTPCGSRRAPCRSRSPSTSARYGPTSAILAYVPRNVAQVGPSADGAITSYDDRGQHRRHDLHHRDLRRLGRRRQDEDRDLRPGRRPLRPPRSVAANGAHRRGDRDRRRRARASRAGRLPRRRASRCGSRGRASRRSGCGSGA